MAVVGDSKVGLVVEDSEVSWHRVPHRKVVVELCVVEVGGSVVERAVARERFRVGLEEDSGFKTKAVVEVCVCVCVCVWRGG